MSTAEPFMPFDEPPADADPTDHDLDRDTDVIDEAATDDPDAERAAAEERLHAEGTPYRRPVAGDRLSAEQLEDDLRDS